MHVFFDPNFSVDWQEVFEVSNVSQSGAGEPYPEYFRPRGFIGIQNQRGAGIGGILSRLFSFLIPIAKAAGRTIGSEALLASGQIASDLASGRNLSESLKDRSARAYNRVIEKAATKMQTGGGRRSKPKKTTSIKKKKIVKKRSLTEDAKKIKKRSKPINRRSQSRRKPTLKSKAHLPFDIFE